MKTPSGQNVDMLYLQKPSFFTTSSRVVGPAVVQIGDDHAVVHLALWPVRLGHGRPHRPVGALQLELAVGGVERLGALLALVLDRLELGHVLVGGQVFLERERVDE